MWDWLGGHQSVFAFFAAIVATLLGAYLVLRSPRNSFTILLTLMVACVAEWNFFEWLDRGRGEWPMKLQFVGVALLPALLLHFAVSLAGLVKMRTAILACAYAVALAFAVLALGALLDGRLAAYFSREGNYNLHFVVFEGPVILAALGVLGVTAFSGPRETRGVVRTMLAGALPAGIFGILDLLTESGVEGAPGLANLGALVGSAAGAATALRNPDLFDSLSILRRETAGLLARTRHGVVAFDEAGAVVFSNGLAGRLLGEVPRSLADLDALIPGIRQRGGSRYLRRGDRVLRASLVPGSPRLGGAPRRHLLVEDCTEEARLLGELAQSESMAALGEVTAQMAHELRNALTAVGTTVETLSREPDPDSGALRGLDAEVRRLQGSLTGCLSLARVVSPDRQEVDLHRLLRRVSETIPAGGEVRLEPADPAPAVYADPDLLGQVFHNLLRNAVEAGAHEIRLNTRREGGEAVVIVRNDGPPIPEGVAPRLFEPFVTGRASGTGLGLAICRKIVAAHGGRISGRNTPGGVEFEVRLPWTS
jgi:signal transduction histidine kinase